MKRKISKILSMILALVLIFSLISIACVSTNAASFDDINQSSVFLKGGTYKSDCVLTACAMMLRRTAMATGNSSWSSINATTLKPYACVSGSVNVYYSFSYSGISVKHASLPGGSSNESKLINLLASHPEGIVLYNSGNSGYYHAILLTDYTNGVFYCADPDRGPDYGRIPISQAYKNKVTITNATEYWYVSSPAVSLAPSDTTAPVINGLYTQNYSSDGFDVICEFSDNVDVSSVRIAVWTSNNGQDDLIWSDATIVSSNNYANLRVNRSEHNYEYGQYIIHAYVYDAAGNNTCLGIDKWLWYSAPASISNINVVNLSKYGYRIMCDIDNVSLITNSNTEFYFQTWAYNTDSSNCLWYKGTLEGNTITSDYIFPVDWVNYVNIYMVYGSWDKYWLIEGEGGSTLTVDTRDYDFSTYFHNGHIYEIHKFWDTWQNAKDYCEDQRGGHLLTIEDADELDFINRVIRENEAYAYYIGATDEDNEGDWKWINGNPIECSNWADGEPDNHGGNQNHIWIRAKSTDSLFLKWDDVAGNDWSVGFICEIEPENYKPVTSTQYGDSTYELYDYNLTYEEAQEFCKTHGGNLASITSEEEQNAVYQMLKDYNYSNDAFIGGKLYDNNWRWEDGSAFNFTNWGTNQPNKYYGENNIVIESANGLWNDVQGNDTVVHKVKLGFILKKQNHTHTFNTWEKDSENHWHKCTECGEVADTAAHIYDDDIDTTCNVCGYERQVETPVIDPPTIDENDTHIAVNGKTARPGEEIKVTVSLKNAPKITSMAASDIVYDKNVLTLKSAEWLPENSTMQSWNSTSQKGVIIFENERDLNGDVLELTFVVSDSAEDGEYNIGLTFKMTENEEQKTVAVKEGKITVKNHITGDMNGDEKITDQDAIYLLFSYYFPDEYPINQPADFNKDGKVTDQDAIYLLFHYYFPEEYPIE